MADAPFRSDTDLLAPPRRPGELGWLAHYRVLREIGAGGMGVVFEAEDTSLDRRVALKVMKLRAADGAVARERFVREAKAAAAVRHDHIVTIYQVGEDRGVPYIALEFLKGVPLDAWLKANPRPPLAHAVRIARQVADGLAAAHAQGLIHRDIKPANVWLEAPKGRVKLLDFGLARPAGDAHLTEEGAILGTPAYMSPEQGRGAKVDARTDLWSLGVMLYRMCTGAPPFAGPNVMAVLTALAVDTPAPVRDRNPDVPPALADLIDRLLCKDAAGRPASAVAVSDELRRIEPTLPKPGPAKPAAGPAETGPHAPVAATITTTAAATVATTGTRPAVPPARRGRWPRRLAGAALGLAVAVAAVALMKAPADPPGDPPAEPSAVAPPVLGAVVPAAVGLAPTTVELLPRVDPATDASGTGPWEWTRTGIRGDGRKPDGKGGHNILTLPYRPPAEYDLIVDVTTPGPSAGGLAYYVPLPGGRGVECAVGNASAKQESGSWYGFEATDGQNQQGSQNPSSRRGPSRASGKRMTTEVEVRTTGVRLKVDGKVIAEVAGLKRLDLPHWVSWPREEKSAVRLIVLGGPMEFHRVAVVEVSGRGTFTRPPVPRPPVDLLALMGPAGEIGKFEPLERTPAGVQLTSPGKHGGLTPPYRLPAEYDLAVEFTSVGGFSTLTYSLPLPTGQGVQCFIGNGAENRVYGYEAIDGRAGGGPENPSVRLGPARARGVRMASRVEVRRTGLRTLIDGAVVAEFTDLSRVAMPGWITKSDPPRPVFVVLGGPVVFHKIEVTEVSGRGEVIRPPPAGTKPP